MVTSKGTPIREGLNLAVKKAKHHQGGPASIGPKSHEDVVLKQKVKKKSAQEKKKAAAAVENQVLTRTEETARTHGDKQPQAVRPRQEKTILR